MADPALHTAALAGLEYVVNKALELDPGTRNRLAQLNGKVLLIHCLSPDIKAYCLPTSDGLLLKSWQDDSHITSSLSGTFSDFVQLLQADDKAAALINGELTVRGESGDFIALQSALADLNVDWEQPLARIFGDVGGHQLGRFIRSSLALGKQLNENVHAQIEEFLHTEASLLPPRAELDAFYADISSLGQRVDRLEARVQRVNKLIAERSTR